MKTILIDKKGAKTVQKRVLLHLVGFGEISAIRLVSDLRNMAGTTRLELATSAVTGQRSNQLNYVPAEGCCARMVGSIRFERMTFRV